MDCIKDAIRHFSGDGKVESSGSDDADLVTKGNTADVSLSGLAQTNAAKHDEMEAASVVCDDSDDEFLETTDSDEAKNDLSLCKSCNIDLACSKAKGSMNCLLCDEWFCLNCANFKKTEFVGAVIKRADIFWVCQNCIPVVPQVLNIVKSKKSLIRSYAAK